jgi:hypothetical protein
MYRIEIQNSHGEWERRSEFPDAYPLTAICDIGQKISQVLKRTVRVIYANGAAERTISQWDGVS